MSVRPSAPPPVHAGDARRDDYRHFLAIPTRWQDNDIYGHVNNVVYYAYFDTIISDYLIRTGGLDIHGGPVIAVAAETFCRFHKPVSHPDTIDAGLRVGHLGRRSVRYEIGLFRQGQQEAAATGHFVHVFVERGSRQPTEIPPPLAAALARLVPGG